MLFPLILKFAKMCCFMNNQLFRIHCILFHCSRVNRVKKKQNGSISESLAFIEYSAFKVALSITILNCVCLICVSLQLIRKVYWEAVQLELLFVEECLRCFYKSCLITGKMMKNYSILLRLKWIVKVFKAATNRRTNYNF